ncbi:MAG: tetratricopeptide repeat protein [Desulfosarcina sp.]
MAKGVSTRKQLLKEPDQFITFSGKLIAFGRSHFKVLSITAGCLLALLVIAATVYQVSERNEKKASEQIERVLAQYAAALRESNPKRAHEQVKSEMNQMLGTHGSKKALHLIRVLYADISYRAGDSDTAIAMYSRALDDFKNEPALKNTLWSGLGYAHVQKEEYPPAIGYFEMIAAGSEKTLRSDALFNLAWLYEATGEMEKSRDLYRQLQAEFPNMIYNELVREKISG